MCTDTTYKFSDLSESAKQNAREEFTSDGYLDYEWWDGVYEDAVHMGALLGIEISRPICGKRKDTNIYFSGFYSQGDGASFEGSYRCVPDAVVKVQAETNDEELIRIAQELTLLQVTGRIKGYKPFSATITRSGRGCHSCTMDVSLSGWGVDEDDDPNQYYAEIEKQITQLMRDFADWIYKQLEAQNDCLYSNECVDEQLNDLDDEYDEFGSKI